MAAVSTIIGGVIAGGSLIQQYRAGQKMKRLSKEDARLQGIIADATRESSEEQAGITKEQEALRRQEATNNATRARRNIIRQGQIARSQALTTGARAGALQSSSLQGGLSQITQGEAAATVGVNEAFARGERNFDLNEQLIDSQERLNQLTGTINQQRANVNSRLQGIQGDYNLYGTIGGIGMNIMNNRDLLNRVGGGSSGGGISIGGGL